MIKGARQLFWMCLGLLLTMPCWGAGVIINEIMYRPPVETNKEEYIELLNTGTNDVDLAGWRFTTGIRFAFTNRTILPPGGYLVVVQHAPTFTNKYPGVGNFVGDWDGILSNSGQLLELVDASGQRADSVRYSDEGDWARRVKGPIDYGHRGWEWGGEADGGGKSLELMNPDLSNKHGQNWAPSTVPDGTPGRANSVSSKNIAPLILDTEHFPLVPKSTESVAIRARIVDESTNGLAVAVQHRVDGKASFTVTAMADDGLHGDGAPGDGVYGALLPPQTNDTIVEFYVEARDAGNHSRTWPAPALIDGAPAPAANLLYQVDDSADAGSQPLYRLILTAADQAELSQINRNSPPPPLPSNDQTRSHAEMNGTFISLDGAGVACRYNVGIRNRGNGSRSLRPQNYRVNFPNDQLWKQVRAVNINAQHPHAQLFGSAIYRRAGLPTQETRAVQVRVNNANLATSGAPSYGFYACNEVLNSEFAAHAFPQDSSGNIYRGIRISGAGADLHYEGEAPSPYRVNYFKQTNTSQDDWTDLIELTRVLDNASDENYVREARRVANVEEWMLYFAIETLADNKETNLANGCNGTGQGDDYSLYRGMQDRRFNILPYDLDTIFNQGNSRGNIQDSLFRMITVPVLNRFMKQPEFAPIYYRQLKRVIDTTLSPEQLHPLADQVLSSYVPASVIDSIKTFAAARNAYVLSQIPLAVTLAGNLPLLDGYYYSTNSTVSLMGRANVIETRSVLVNGAPAAWSAWNGRWTNSAVTLHPGINRVLVQSLDANGNEFDRTTIDIWYDDGGLTNVSGTMTVDTTWSPGAGPYFVIGPLTVPAGVTLTIEPGTTVYFAPGAGVTVNGRLQTEGTDREHIRLTRQPGAAENWGGIAFSNSGVESRLTYVDVEFSGSGGPSIHANSAIMYLDHVTFAGSTSQYVTLDNSSFAIRSSVFPTTAGVPLIRGNGLPAVGHGIFEGNFFGTTTGLNDIIDFTGGQRPGAILQILNNIFSGASDDVLDLDGTDAHIEGNIFMHAHQTASTVDASSAISGGQNGSSTSQLVIVRNLFFDCDHIALAKEGNFYTLVNNTALHLTKAGVAFDEPGRRLSDGVTPGRGAYLDGNIIWDTPFNFEDVYVNDPVFGATDLTVHRSILAGPDYRTNGIGNLALDPRLVNTLADTITSATITNDLRLRAGSPAMGMGPNGLDMGAFVPAGVSISGEPRSPTFHTSATLTVGGPGYKNPGLGSVTNYYRYRVNEGPWSGEIEIDRPLQWSGLTNGAYTVYVVGQNDAGVWQHETNATVSKTWVVNTNYSRLLINEVLARNVSAVPHQDNFPDLVELYNDGARPVDLAGMGLTDNATNHYKFVFPPGTTLASEEYLVLCADNDYAAPGLHLGFSLKQSGDDIYLYDKPGNGGTLLDQVVFGMQLPDLSIGRLAGGGWVLTLPTFGAANVAQPTGDAGHLKINEWLAAAQTLFQDDFVELYNPDSLPVSLGGLFLTDNRIGLPTRHEFAPLSFIAGGDLAAFTADGRPDQGADHLSFALASEQGMLTLFSPQLDDIDAIVYGPQQADVSEGRSPNGAVTLAFFPQPTPGGGNPGSVANTNINIVTLNLITITNTWKYDESGDLGAAWSGLAYDDSAWPTGRALLYVESDPLPAPKSTELNLGKITYYFRTHFNFTAGGTEGLRLEASTVIDDGAVIYLNGHPVLWIGMDANDVIGYGTRASRTVGDANYEGPFPNAATNLVAGDNLLAVEVHQSSSGSSDIVFGLALDAVLTTTNMTTDRISVVLNEVLASNLTLTNNEGLTSDWVELYNPDTNSVDLADLSLSNDTATPRWWVFPPGSILPGKGYLLIQCDDSLPASSANTGFNLKAGGDGVYLFDKPDRDSRLLDSVVFGIQVGDFSIGRLGAGTGGWTLTLPTPAAVNIAAALGEASALRINEWMADPAQGDDWFELYNPNAQAVELSGFYLTDDLNKRAQYRILPLSFIGYGPQAFLKFTADGTQGQSADHVNFKLGAGGEAIGLLTANGVMVDSVVFGAQLPGISQGRLPDGTATIVRFPSTPSPGESNYLPLTNVVINEVLSHTDPPLEDAIELYNATATPVSIGGWFLSNSQSQPRKHRIPDDAVIPAGSYKVFYEYQFNPDFSGVPPSFSLNSAHGDEVWLSQADVSGNLSGYRTHVKFGAAPKGVSFGRYRTSVGVEVVALTRRTFGADNSNSLSEFRTGTGLPNAPPVIGPVVITEIMYHPVTGDGTNATENADEEFIELYNFTATPVPLYDSAFPENTWRLHSAVDYAFPASMILPAGGRLLVVGFDPVNQPAGLSAFRGKYGLPDHLTILGPYRGRLDNSGESVSLSRPDPPQMPPHPDAGFVPYVLVDRVAYSDATPWPTNADGGGASLQRLAAGAYGNDPANWKAAAPTPQSTDFGAVDSDGDGMSDLWEIVNQLRPDDPEDAAFDFDSDGFTNLQEYIAGTNPRDAGSALNFETEILSGNIFSITFTAMAGKSYTVQYRDSLSSGFWQKLADVAPQAASTVVQVNDSSANSSANRYYRIVTPAVP